MDNLLSNASLRVQQQKLAHPVRGSFYLDMLVLVDFTVIIIMFIIIFDFIGVTLINWIHPELMISHP